MARYLIAIHRPNSYDASVSESKEMALQIDALNDEMVASGVRVFVGGLQPLTTAISLVPNAERSVRQMTGSYLQTNEHVGGFWVLEVSSQDEAIAWGQKAAVACRAAVEVRPFY